MSGDIGIKFGGTTLSVVARAGGCYFVIGENDDCDEIPSVLANTSSGRPIYGSSAEQQMWIDRTRTVRPTYRAWDTLPYPPEAITLFREIRKQIEKKIGERAPAIVATCPLFFGDRERQALKNAILESGWDCLRIINESTAAITALQLHQAGFSGTENTILVVKVGGTMTSSAVVDYNAEDDFTEVQSEVHDLDLGGEQFTYRIIDHLSEEFVRAHGVDPRGTPYAMQRLFDAAEKAKRALGTADDTAIWLPSIISTPTGSHAIEADLSRAQFDDMTAPLVRRIGKLVEQSMVEAAIAPDEVDAVLILGRASQTKAVKAEIVRVAGQQPLHTGDTNTLAAHGASIFAGRLGGFVCGMRLLDEDEFSDRSTKSSEADEPEEEEDPETDHW
ncbi:MAG: Hsp70 family protein [Candidatus Obscuribacterales bacterium]